jgi:hypothetical protein
MCSLVMNCKCLSGYELCVCLVMKLQVSVVTMYVTVYIYSEVELACCILYAIVISTNCTPRALCLRGVDLAKTPWIHMKISLFSIPIQGVVGPNRHLPKRI